MLRKIGRMEGAERWIEEYYESRHNEGKRLEDIAEDMTDRIDGYVRVDRAVGLVKRRKELHLLGWM